MIMIIVIAFVITFMQGIKIIYPKQNLVSSERNIRAKLYSQLMVHVMLFPMLNVL
jgi:hypothetical protein